MSSLSRVRNASSTAFFSHSFTTQPPPRGSATRAAPESRSASDSAIASSSSSDMVLGVRRARSSKAASMKLLILSVSLMVGLVSHGAHAQEIDDARGGLHALRQGWHQGNAHPLPARV